MKNIILTLILCLSTYVGNSQDYAVNTIKVDLMAPNYSLMSNDETTINLKLPSRPSISSDDRKSTYAVILIAGLAFTAASLLENGSSYGTYNNTGPYTQQYVTPPMYQQTPRNIMFCVGVGLTLTSIIGFGSK